MCIVGKSWDYHVTDTPSGRRSTRARRWWPTPSSSWSATAWVMFDAEHFFDGYKRNPEFALRVLEAAVEKGATHLVLCDTNGGSLPFEVEEIVGRQGPLP